jgi:hypothetical protein
MVSIFGSWFNLYIHAEIFNKNWCGTHPVIGLEQLSEGCFCYLAKCRRFIKKIRETGMPLVTCQESMLSVFSAIGEDIQHRCFIKEYYVKNAMFANNYCIQIRETVFDDQIYVSQDGVCTCLLKISVWTYRMNSSVRWFSA